MDLRAYSSVG